MNRLIIGFIFFVLVSRFFTETLGIAPKAIDLLDLGVIPLLLIISAGSRPPSGVDLTLHRKLLQPTVAFFLIAILSAAVNFERVYYGPLMLYVFGMLEGPILFLSLNKLISDKKAFGRQLVRFIDLMLLIEIAAVLLVSYPAFILSGNPDKMSGTFGNNSYQFTVLLIIIGGYLLGRQLTSKKSFYITIAVQLFVVLTFILLQYRTAVPSFFLAYIILAVALFGKRMARAAMIGIPIIVIAVWGFRQIKGGTDIDLKYRDLVTLAADVDLIFEYGKFQAYVNTVSMYGESPITILFGSGPGTFVSRANYTFTMELHGNQSKGVGPIVLALFGDHDYESDVYRRYIEPLSGYEALFGSVQINNPNSSILATAAETGIPGLVFMVIIYATMVRRAFRYLRFAAATRDPVLLPLASALLIGSVYLALISPLDNYLEIARVTLPIWLLFWTVSTLVHQQKQEYLAWLAYQEQLAGGQQ